MKKYILSVILYFLLTSIALAWGTSIIGSTIGSEWTPADIENVLVYLDSSRQTGYLNNDNVNNLTDYSGNNINFCQTTATSQPKFMTNILNGQPGIYFDGINDAISRNSTELDNLFTVGTSNIIFLSQCVTYNNTYFFAKTNSGLTEGYYFLPTTLAGIYSRITLYNRYTVSFHQSRTTDREYELNANDLYIMEYNATSTANKIIIYENNVLKNTDLINIPEGTPPDDSNHDFVFGNTINLNKPFKGYLFLFIIVKGEMTANEREKLYAYAQRKFGI